MGIETAEQYGGSGASFFSAIIAIEELARADASVSVMCDVQNTLVATLVRQYGSDTLKDKYLPQLAQESVGSFALSEPDSGSDAFALRSTAKKLPDGGYVLNGNKCWITNGAEGNFKAHGMPHFANRLSSSSRSFPHFCKSRSIQRLQGHYMFPMRKERWGCRGQEGKQTWDQSKFK